MLLLSCPWCILFRREKKHSMICQFIVGWVLTLRGCLLLKYYIDIPLAWEHVETIEFYKKCCATTVCFQCINHFHRSVPRCYSIFPQMSVPRMRCFHTGLFVACVQSDFATCDPWVVSSQRLGFLSLRGREPMRLWRLNVESAHTTRCELFSETAHCTHRQRLSWTNSPGLCIC